MQALIARSAGVFCCGEFTAWLPHIGLWCSHACLQVFLLGVFGTLLTPVDPVVLHSGGGSPALHLIPVPPLAGLRQSCTHFELHCFQAYVHAGLSFISVKLMCMQG